MGELKGIPEFSETLEEIVREPACPEVFNTRNQQLLNNDMYLQEKKLDKDAAMTFSEAENRTNISSGDKLPTILSKIKKFFTDIKTVAFTGNYTDLSNQPTASDIGAIPTTGGVVTGNVVREESIPGSPAGSKYQTVLGKNFTAECYVSGVGTLASASLGCDGLSFERTVDGVKKKITASGIDDTPGGTEGSTDLITSGAVHSALSNTVLPKVVLNKSYDNADEVKLSYDLIKSGLLYFISVQTFPAYAENSAFIMAGHNPGVPVNIISETTGSTVKFSTSTSSNERLKITGVNDSIKIISVKVIELV